MKQFKLLFLLAIPFIMASCCGGEKKCTEKKDCKTECTDKGFKKEGNRHWVWVRPNEKDDEATLAEHYKKYYESGIRGIFFGSDSEKHFRAAKAQGLETHLWYWIMNRGDFLETKPEIYAVSRDGKSCATNPPYVDYYRWMCPSHPEVKQYLSTKVDEYLKKDYIDGIHMDYVRYSDVVLAVNLWKTYNIEQVQELPEYDFCYCKTCKTKFKEQYGREVFEKYPQEDLSWRRFRYDAVSNVVKGVVESAQKNNKPVTAAVFPTPEVALRCVRQDWTSWDLDAVYPMIYHGFYQENVPWIGTAVKECLHGINGKFPIYAGLYLPDFKNNDEIRQGVEIAMKSGADGVSIFGSITDDVLQILKDNK